MVGILLVGDHKFPQAFNEVAEAFWYERPPIYAQFISIQVFTCTKILIRLSPLSQALCMPQGAKY